MLIQINRLSKQNKEFYREFTQLLNSLMSQSKLDDFLVGILTPAELEQLIKRLQIIKRLKKGEPQRQIADDLDVGIATVTRGARELKNGRFDYVK